MSDESLRQYFDECVMLYKKFDKQTSVDNRKLLGISASSTNNASRKKIIKCSPEDHYYEWNEWYALIKSVKEMSLSPGAQ